MKVSLVLDFLNIKVKFRNFDERLLEISYKIKTYIDKKVIFEFTVNKDSN